MAYGASDHASVGRLPEVPSLDISGLRNRPVIEIPEILADIIALLPLSCLANAALVCQQWNDLALPEIWRDVPRLAYVLRLLTPLDSSDSSAQARHPRGTYLS